MNRQHSRGCAGYSGVSGGLTTDPGPCPTVSGMVTPEDEARIAAYVDELVEAAPDLTPDQLDRLRRLVAPAPTPRPRGSASGARPDLGAGPT